MGAFRTHRPSAWLLDDGRPDHRRGRRTARRPGRGGQREPILIGSINDITGFAATFGIPERDGQRLAVKAIYDAGASRGRTGATARG